MALDRAAVQHIARLARIKVPESDLADLAKELSGILGWVEQLAQVNTEGVEPMSGAAPMALKMREDKVTEGGIRDRVLANAPQTKDGFFVVPRVVE